MIKHSFKVFTFMRSNFLELTICFFRILSTAQNSIPKRNRKEFSQEDIYTRWNLKKSLSICRKQHSLLVHHHHYHHIHQNVWTGQQKLANLRLLYAGKTLVSVSFNQYHSDLLLTFMGGGLKFALKIKIAGVIWCWFTTSWC